MICTVNLTTLSVRHTIKRRMVGFGMDDEWERMCFHSSMALFEMPGGTEETLEPHSQDSR
jgi:hypothetical protein